MLFLSLYKKLLNVNVINFNFIGKINIKIVLYCGMIVSGLASKKDIKIIIVGEMFKIMLSKGKLNKGIGLSVSIIDAM